MPNTATVAEIVSFELAQGVSDAQFIEISQKTKTFVRTSAGFISRNLSKGDDGRWTDYVLWQSMDAALTTAAEFPKQPFAPELMAAIKPDSVTMQHQNLLWQM